MGLLDKIKSSASEMMTQAKEPHVQVKVTSGKKCFYMDFLDTHVVIRQRADGAIYFDDIEGFYKVVDFQWGGPEYVSTSRTTETTTAKGKIDTYGTTKRTGRVTGAVVGSLIAPGAGTLIGAMVGTGKKHEVHTGGRGISQTTGWTFESKGEAATSAFMTLTDISSRYTFTFGFECNSKIYGDVMNMIHRNSYVPMG